MPDSDDFPDAIAQGVVTLVVGRPSGRKMRLDQIPIGRDVAAAFREVASRTLADLSEREGEAWAPDADLSPETYLKLDVVDVGESPVVSHGGADIALVEALRVGETLEVLLPQHLPAGDLSFYAVVIGDTAGERAVFIRRSNPRRGLKRGRIYSLLTDTLTRIEEPIFAFDEWFDLVVIGSDMLILNQTVFAAMFRSQDALIAQVPQWTTELNAAVGISDDGRSRVSERAQKDSRLRARLEAIVRRNHLPTVSTQTLRDAMVTAGLDATALLNAQGEFIMEDEHIAPVLYFLNEDLFTGSLTSTNFRADKKAAR